VRGVIDFQNVDKSFGAQQVLANVSFRINSGEHVGIVGPNGTGKSTVFSLISGELTPDRGNVVLPANCSLGYLHQELRPQSVEATLLEYAESGAPELLQMQRDLEHLSDRLKTETGQDNADVLAQLGDVQSRFEVEGGYALRHRAEIALSGLGFSEDLFGNAFGSFSGGWQMRAELARVTVAKPDVLLMDEPSNYLDTVAIEWLQRFLREYEGTLVLISHDRYLLNSLTKVTIEIANAEATRYPGNYDYYIGERLQRHEFRLATQKKLDRKREQAERFIERFRAKNTKASQVQSKIKMLERMDEVRPMQRVVSPGRIRIPAPPRCGQEVVRLDDVGLTYDDERWVLRHVDLVVERGNRMAFVGLNGTGKTTLLRILVGQLAPSEGRVRLGHNVTAGYQSQEFAETLDPHSTVFDSVKRVAPECTAVQVRTLLGGFGFSGESVEKRVQVLSGGEKVRLAFARLLVSPPSLLVLDEPTTHLDIPAREALEDGLRNYSGTLCVVSHDIEFVRNVATTTVSMDPPGIRRYAGGYDYYREKVAQPGSPRVPVGRISRTSVRRVSCVRAPIQ
jgi:ATP-binding cassette subfamily F protein 3